MKIVNSTEVQGRKVRGITNDVPIYSGELVLTLLDCEGMDDTSISLHDLIDLPIDVLEVVTNCVTVNDAFVYISVIGHEKRPPGKHFYYYKVKKNYYIKVKLN